MTESWDAVVIGSGLGGLTAAAAYAQRGKRVLILERLGNFGGAATIYRHNSLTIEASLHETDGATALGRAGLFSRLGLSTDIKLAPTDNFYEVRGGPLPASITIGPGLAATQERLIEALPRFRQVIEKALSELRTLHDAVGDLEGVNERGAAAILAGVLSGRLFKLAAVTRKTLAQRWHELLGDAEALKFALGAPIFYFDDDPAALSYLLYAAVWSRYVEDGAFYIKGGSRALSLALVQKARRVGGQARHRCEAMTIMLDGRGRVAGVRFKDAAGVEHEALAPVVFANAAPARIAEMLPAETRGAFAHAFEAHEPSISLFTVALGLSKPASSFGVSSYSTFIFPDDLSRFADVPQACARFAAAPADKMPPYVLADYGRLDAGLRQDGEPYLVSLCGVDRLSWWEGMSEAEEMSRREAWRAALVSDLDRRFPGLGAATVHAEIAVARTMKNRLGTPFGEVYGFRPTPTRLFARAPSARTPVPGLFIASAYTVSGGFAGAMQGGLMAADAAG